MIGETTPEPLPEAPQAPAGVPEEGHSRATEIGGRDGPEPTRYGDWEKNGRCIDF
ncbi:DUF1674 domain-containing protein [Marilutibacter spongiae]|uniref:DUF1674 domain-containing protein n=1 Tax=Marilutibacter spongiae TaxID=2025720 RepID=A0A7W3TJH2_9GAMM|nr:DUF1674 domain-containing protein [Lysobacter spongiae]MBB1059426.1 DUF1674 domain-containing protein [Lysobacter spongiae]